MGFAEGFQSGFSTVSKAYALRRQNDIAEERLRMEKEDWLDRKRAEHMDKLAQVLEATSVNERGEFDPTAPVPPEVLDAVRRDEYVAPIITETLAKSRGVDPKTIRLAGVTPLQNGHHTFLVEHVDPKTGKPITAGPLTEQGTSNPDDVVVPATAGNAVQMIRAALATSPRLASAYKDYVRNKYMREQQGKLLGRLAPRLMERYGLSKSDPFIKTVEEQVAGGVVTPEQAVNAIKLYGGKTEDERRAMRADLALKDAQRHNYVAQTQARTQETQFKRDAHDLTTRARSAQGDLFRASAPRIAKQYGLQEDDPYIAALQRTTDDGLATNADAIKSLKDYGGMTEDERRAAQTDLALKEAKRKRELAAAGLDEAKALAARTGGGLTPSQRREIQKYFRSQTSKMAEDATLAVLGRDAKTQESKALAAMARRLIAPLQARAETGKDAFVLGLMNDPTAYAGVPYTMQLQQDLGIKFNTALPGMVYAKQYGNNTEHLDEFGQEYESLRNALTANGVDPSEDDLAAAALMAIKIGDSKKATQALLKKYGFKAGEKSEGSKNRRPTLADGIAGFIEGDISKAATPFLSDATMAAAAVSDAASLRRMRSDGGKASKAANTPARQAVKAIATAVKSASSPDDGVSRISEVAATVKQTMPDVVTGKKESLSDDEQMLRRIIAIQESSRSSKEKWRMIEDALNIWQAMSSGSSGGKGFDR